MAALEDYTELIADLIARQGEARTTDIAERLGVAHPTASKAIGRLEREGLAVAKPYRGVSLTAAGRTMAERSRRRHRLVVDFLVAVGAPREAAEADAEQESSTTSRRRRWRRSRRSSPRSANRDQLLPIRTPAASTSPPPSMTLAAAESGGVSM